MVVQIICYLGVLIFLAASLSRIIKVARMPVHLRWELYPVPHEKGRAHYGGSKMEESNFWEKEAEKDHLNELKEMGTEIVFLKAVWEYNRRLWVGSFPFHFSLYMMIINMDLFFAAGIIQLSGVSIGAESTGFWSYYYYAVMGIAWVSVSLGLFGSIRLMFNRLVDTGLRNHSNLSHYFNIIFIGLLSLSLLGWLITDPMFFENLRDFYAGMISFGAVPELGTWGVIHVVLTMLFVSYLPFTHMSHMYMKYFLYHLVRWEDEDNKPGSKLSKTLGEQLAYPVSWSAAHIGADGKKNWGDVVAEIPKDEKNDK